MASRDAVARGLAILREQWPQIQETPTTFALFAKGCEAYSDTDYLAAVEAVCTQRGRREGAPTAGDLKAACAVAAAARVARVARPSDDTYCPDCKTRDLVEVDGRLRPEHRAGCSRMNPRTPTPASVRGSARIGDTVGVSPYSPGDA